MKPRKPIRRVSLSKAATDRIYHRDAKAFLDQFPWCEWFLRQSPPQKVRAEQCHHQRGRIGKLKLDRRFWLPVSAIGHDIIHVRQVARAMELGLLPPKGQFNEFVDANGFQRNGVKVEFPKLSPANLQYAK